MEHDCFTLRFIVNFKTGGTGFIYRPISLVGRLGLGAWSWVRIGLADKAWFSVSYECLTQTSECLTTVCNAILETEIFCRQYLNINNSCNK